MLNIAAAKRSAKLWKKQLKEIKKERRNESAWLTGERTLENEISPSIWRANTQRKLSEEVSIETKPVTLASKTKLRLLETRPQQDPIETEAFKSSSFHRRRRRSTVRQSSAVELALVGKGLDLDNHYYVADETVWEKAYNNKSLQAKREAERKRGELGKETLEKDTSASFLDLLGLLKELLLAYTIYPQSKRHLAWEVVLVSLVFYNAITLPYALAFWLDGERPGFISYLDVLSDYFFVVDLIHNFWLAYLDEYGRVVTDKSAIAKHYLQTWFTIDLVACIPLEYFLPSKYVTASNMLKCVRLLRMAKVMRVLDRFQFATFARVGRLFVAIMLLCHWIACFWIYTGGSSFDADNCGLVSQSTAITLGKVWDPTSSTPSGQQILDSCAWIVDRGLDNPSITSKSKYLKALHWAITTVMTVGYGDITPAGRAEIIFYIFVILSGAGIYASLFSIIVKIIESGDSAANRYAVLTEDVQEQMQYLRFPEILQQRIISYYRYVFTRQKQLMGGRPFYKYLPPPAKRMCASFLYGKQLSNVYFLKDCSDDFIVCMAEKLISILCVPQETIVHQGDRSDAWYLVTNGFLNVFQNESEKALRVLEPGDSFGEIGLLSGSLRTASVQSKTYCDLCYISVHAFYSIVLRYEQDNKQILRNCKDKLQRFNAMPTQEKRMSVYKEEDEQEDDSTYFLLPRTTTDGLPRVSSISVDA